MSEDKIVINRIFFKGAEDLQAFFGTKEWNTILNSAKKELFLKFDLKNMDNEVAYNTYLNMLAAFTATAINDLVRATRKQERKKEVLLMAKEIIIETLMDIPKPC